MQTVRTVCNGVATVFLVPMSRTVFNSVYPVMRGPAAVARGKRYVNGMCTNFLAFLLRTTLVNSVVGTSLFPVRFVVILVGAISP